MEHSTDEVSEVCKSERIQKMHIRICQIKASEKTEVKYMQSWEEKILIKQEGIAEGEQIGRSKEKTEFVKKLSNKFSIEQIAEMLEIDISEVEKIIKEIRKVNDEVIIMVDNCYGEFVEEKEPIEAGADIAVGSLMKNLGAGIATSGAYIVGRKDLVELCAERLTSPGIGKEIGPSLGQNTQLLKGLFFAPQVVASSVKTAIFASRILEKLGYDVEPKYDEVRADIVQTIKLGSEENLVKFCQGIQMGSPIDSNVIPFPSDMGGYEDKVIMAAGTFTEGSTIELSCDGPIREPFIAYMQGGLTYPCGKIGVLKAIELIEQG